MDDPLRKIGLRNATFTADERARLRSDLLDRAVEDRRIVSGAITGSAASGCEDEWSDIDLAFAVANDAPLVQVLSDWTAHMYDQHAAVHHLDTHFGSWIYRTFLLPSTLQVDLAFAPTSGFQPLGPAFTLIFGAANEAVHFEPPKPAALGANSWAAVHCARASIAKGELWQAEYFLSTARDNALASACLRHNLPWHHGRGFDLLPSEIKAAFEKSFPPSLSATGLCQALDVVAETLEGAGLPISTCANPAFLESDYAIGLAWLYAVHARSCIARQRWWQAEYMIRGLRDNALALACFQCDNRRDLGRRPDILPDELSSAFRSTRVQSLSGGELARAFHFAIKQLVRQISFRELRHAEQLERTLAALSESVSRQRIA